MPPTTFLKDDTSQRIFNILKASTIQLQIPDYLDADEVNDVLEDATILAQYDNEHNFCVLAAWIDKDDPLHTMIYFSRFFNIGSKTVVSHDANENNLIDMILKLSELSNRHFA